MKIEITDRAQWLDRVNAAISRIETERKKQDMEYVDWWHRSLLGGRLLLLIWPEAKPSPAMFEYPSIHGFIQLNILRSMRRALLDTGTGALFFDDEEAHLAPQCAEYYASISGKYSAQVHCAIDHF
jgi:hypothetical protein